MYKIFVICLFASCASAFKEPKFRDDYKYYEEVNGWIKFHKIPANWHDARLRCHAEGATIASPSSSSMQNVMTSVMIKESSDPGTGIYSGIHSTFSNGSYTTVEGIPLSVLPVRWVNGQPDHVNSENCVVFHMNGALEDIQCDDAFQYICYKNFENLTMTKCNTVDNEYTLDKRTGHCYKLHRVGHTWSRAHMICQAEGAYLTIINSETEAEVLEELLARYPKDRMFTKHYDVAFVGIREWPEERSWFTVHGQTLEQAGYNKWQNGHPDNVFLNGETQSCGAIWRTARFDDVWCNEQFAFICERDPDASF